MATQNFFALLGDDDTDDPSVVIARAASPKAAEKPAPPGAKKLPPPPPQHQVPAKLPTKPLPPAQAVKERQIAQSDGGRGRGGRGGRSGGRGNYINRDQEGNFTRQGREGGFEGSRGNHSDRYNGNNRESSDLQGGRGSYGGNSAGGVTTYRAYGDASSTGEEGEGGRQSDSGRGRGRGGGRGRGYGYGGEGEERSRRRDYDRRSGSGRGNELKRDGAGRGNWGTDVDQVPLQESVDASFVEEDKPVPEIVEKKPEAETGPDSMNAEEKKEDEEEDNEMTLDEYEKVLIEKRKALEALKAQERRVILDKDFESMQLVDRKQDDDAFIKLGLDKEKGKKKEINEKEEKVKKSVSINEFLKPNEGEEYYSPTGRRGRGRGRSDRGGYRGGYGDFRQYSAPRIEDPGQFPTLGGK